MNRLLPASGNLAAARCGRYSVPVSRVSSVISVIWVLLFIVGGQVSAKIGVAGPGRTVWGLNAFLAVSYALFLARGALWAWVLRHHPVSRVYPFLALAYPLVLLSGMLFFGENLTPGKAAGTLLIVAGSALLMTREAS